MYYHGTIKEEFDGRWKSRRAVKHFMENKVRIAAFIHHTCVHYCKINLEQFVMNMVFSSVNGLNCVV